MFNWKIVPYSKFPATFHCQNQETWIDSKKKLSPALCSLLRKYNNQTLALAAVLFFTSSSIVDDIDFSEALCSLLFCFWWKIVVKNIIPRIPKTVPESTSHQWCLLSAILDSEHNMPQDRQTAMRKGLNNLPVVADGKRVWMTYWKKLISVNNWCFHMISWKS